MAAPATNIARSAFHWRRRRSDFRCPASYRVPSRPANPVGFWDSAPVRRGTLLCVAMPNFNVPLPYYRWYVKDFRASRRVQKLTYVQRGLYRELLDECWISGSIPDDLAKLADICACPIGVIADAWEALKPMFEPTSGMDGMFLNNTRLEDERTEADKVRAARSLSGAKGAKAKQMLANDNKCHIAVKAVAEQSSSSSNSQQKPALALNGPLSCVDCAGRHGIHKPTCRFAGMAVVRVPDRPAGSLPSQAGCPFCGHAPNTAEHEQACADTKRASDLALFRDMGLTDADIANLPVLSHPSET